MIELIFPLYSHVSKSVALTGELVSRAARAGVDWVTIHGRTPAMRPDNPARWDQVAEVISGRVPHIECTSSPLPIFLNGDVASLEDAVKAHAITKCQGNEESLCYFNFISLLAPG